MKNKIYKILTRARIEEISNWKILLLIVALNFSISWSYQNLVMTKSVYYQLLSEQMEVHRIERYIELSKNYLIWGYLAIPILQFIKLIFLALLVQLLLLIKFIDLPFKKIFRIVMFASLATSTGGVFQLSYLLLIPETAITPLVLNTAPLSLTQLIAAEQYSKSSVSVFNTMNMFEIIWGYVMYKGISGTKKLAKVDTAILVLSLWAALLVLKWILIYYLDKINL
jgi:hypothetical protein